MEPERFRFFGVGEYGEKGRPHYHAILFGFANCVYGQTRKQLHFDGESCCPQCDVVRDAWGKGGIQVDQFNAATAGYICKYVLKDQRQADHELGRYPTFTRMSTHPGIGAKQALSIARKVKSEKVLSGEIDVPAFIRFDGEKRQIGQFMRRRIRRGLGIDERTPREIQVQATYELLELRTQARGDQENPSVRSRILGANKTRVESFKARAEIFRKKGKLDETEPL